MIFVLDYLAFRVRPKTLQTDYNNQLLIRSLDVCAAIGNFAGILLTLNLGLQMLKTEKYRYLSAGPIVGSVLLLLMSIYPIHIAVGGDQWLDCIVNSTQLSVRRLLVMCLS